MPQKFRGSAKVTFRDHVSGVFARNRTVRKLMVLWFGGVLLQLAFFPDRSADIVGIVALMAALAMIIVSLIYRFVGYLFLGRGHRAMTWEFEENGICMWDDPGNQIRTPWSEIKGFRETKSWFVLSRRPTGGLLVPKRAFEDEDIDGVRQLLQSNAGKQ